MKTIQQKCADRIYELLPYKKELEFGCELKNIYAPSHHNYTFVSIDNGLVTAVYNGSKEIEKDKMKDIFSDMKLESFEIIGQPIRLADVLMAIPVRMFIDTDGYFKEYDENMNVVSVTNIVKYNLLQDNILEQSNEFCEFVYDLIK